MKAKTVRPTSGGEVIGIVGRAVVLIAVSSFMFGTIFWKAVDIFDLFTENQFTGRMRAFDVEYWDAIRGAAFVVATAALATAINNRIAMLLMGAKEEENE